MPMPTRSLPCCAGCWSSAAATLPAKNIMAQANNLKNLEIPTLLPGIRVNTSPTNHHPLQQIQCDALGCEHRMRRALDACDDGGRRHLGAIAVVDRELDSRIEPPEHMR